MIQLLKDLDELTILKSYVESEALVFHKLQLFCPALSAFIDIVRQIISEIISIRDVLDSLLHNRTQAKFVQIFRPILSNLGSDIEILLFIVDEHLTLSFNVMIYPPIIYEAWSSFNLFVGKIMDRLIDGRTSQQESFPGNLYGRKASQGTGGIVNSTDIEMENNPMRNRYFDADSQSVKVKGIHDRRSYFLTSSSSCEYSENLREEEEGKCFSVYDDVCGDAVARPGRRTVGRRGDGDQRVPSPHPGAPGQRRPRGEGRSAVARGLSPDPRMVFGAVRQSADQDARHR